MPDKTPTIVRIWRGRTTAERADEYEDYNYREGILPLVDKALGVQTLRRDEGGESEFVTISYWEDEAAMRAFTGGDPHDVHHLPRDAEFLVALPRAVEVFRLRQVHGVTR